MATNIEMNVKQESDYEVIYPQTICDMVINLLNPDTKALMGLEPTADADDAFRKVYLAQVLDGRALINFTVMGDDGTPCSGVQIESAQFCDANGNKTTPVETDENGKVSVFVDNISVEASISNYANLSDWSETIAVEFGQQYDKEITLTRYNFKLWESSGKCKFSPEIVRVDVSLCGGGGGGYSGRAGRNYNAGSGGGGGYSKVQENFSFSPQVYYNFSVGSGGAQGSNGGNSSFSNLNASGGKGATSYYVNGTGNGNGGKVPNQGQINGTVGTEGTGYVYISFEDIVNIGGGGGSGSNAVLSYGHEGPVTFYGGAGGSPQGGKGGDSYTQHEDNCTADDGEDGKGYGGGGGGGGVAGVRANESGEAGLGGSGGSGVLSIRMYRQQDLS